MKYHGVSIYDTSLNKFIYAKPMIYNGTSWQTVDIYVYTDNNWALIGAAGTQIVPFVDYNGNYVYVNNSSQPFMVPELLGQKRLKDSDGNFLKDINGNYLWAEYGG